jgi:hypothetical protein
MGRKVWVETVFNVYTDQKISLVLIVEGPLRSVRNSEIDRKIPVKIWHDAMVECSKDGRGFRISCELPPSTLKRSVAFRSWVNPMKPSFQAHRYR